MKDTITKVVLKHYGVRAKNVVALGGGFYGRAFLCELECEPREVVVKLYLFPGIALREAEQLEILAQHAKLKMPRVYGVFEKSETGFAHDVLIMEYLVGSNAGWLDTAELSEAVRDEICEDIVDNLIAFHSASNPRGFGELSSEAYFATWQEYYYPIAESIVEKAKLLLSAGQLSDMIMSVFERSLEQFDRVFYLPIERSSLIHGDYNTWNIMLDLDKKHAFAVIDPCNCCWGDSEYDLYQLDNANGKGYGLLKRYGEKVALSDNFEAKRRFYQLYSEVCHYYDAKVNVDLDSVGKMAERLNEVLI